MINQGPIQHQNESFGHSVHTQSQYHQKGVGLNQQVDQSRHNTNSRMESSMARPDSLVQSIRQSRREKQQQIKKSRQTSNGASKRGTDAGVLNLQSSAEETSANVPRVMPLVYNPGEQIDTPTLPTMKKQKTRANNKHSTNIAQFIKQRLGAGGGMNYEEEKKQGRTYIYFITNVSMMDRGRTTIGALNQTYGSIRKQNVDNLCHCLDNEAIQEPTILIVDDNLFNLIPLELILKEFCGGLKCDKALNGEEAVNLFRKNLQQSQVMLSRASQTSEKCVNCGNLVPNETKFPTYKLVFMDIQMPVLDGYEATRQILQLYNKWKTSQRVTDKEHNLKVIAITSFTNDEAIKNAYECGMTQVLNKPVDVGQIKAVLDRYYHPPQQASGIDVTYSRKQYSAISNAAYPGGF